jgi:hypothetical protein
MSLDADKLRHALFLATGASAPLDEAPELAETLGVAEEALAYVVLTRGGFAESPRLAAELAAAAARAGGPVRSGRPPRLTDAVAEAAAEDELRQALKALIEANLEAAPAHWRADEALRGLVEAQPAGPFDAAARFEPGEWRELRRPPSRRAAGSPSRSPESAADRRRAAIQRHRRRKARKG